MLVLQLLISGLATGLMAAPIAMGFSLIVGVHQFWYLAHGAAFVWVCFVEYAALRELPIWLALVIAPLVAAVIGVVIELGIHMPLRQKRASNLLMLIASLGIYIAATNLAALLFGFDSHVAQGNTFGGLAISGQVTVPWLDVAEAAVGVASALALWSALRSDRFGIGLRAMLADPEMSRIVGIRPDRMRLLAMVIGSALLGLPALVTTVSSGADPNVGLNVVLIAAIATIVGGLGNPMGALAGSVLLSVFSAVPLAWIGTQWEQSIGFAILIIVIVFRPTGIAGRSIWKERV